MVFTPSSEQVLFQISKQVAHTQLRTGCEAISPAPRISPKGPAKTSVIKPFTTQKKVYFFLRTGFVYKSPSTYTPVRRDCKVQLLGSPFQAHTWFYLSIQWLRATLAVLRGLSLQHDCNTHCNTATQRCFLPYNLCFLPLPRLALFLKGLKPLIMEQGRFTL